MLELDAVSVLIDKSLGLRLFIASSDLSNPPEVLQPLIGLPEGWLGYSRPRVPGTGTQIGVPILYDAERSQRGLEVLAIIENSEYFCGIYSDLDGEVKPEKVQIASSLDSQGPSVKWHKRSIYGSGADFRVTNYLGAAWIQVVNYPQVRFDVIPTKIDYETEYRSMVEAIASQCQQLLMEWSGPTSLPFSADPIKQKRILLEQFLFLRYNLGPDRLDLFFEILRRNPHVHLMTELTWNAVGGGNPTLFLQDPFVHGRDWMSVAPDDGISIGGYLPREIQEEHRFENLDTPINRFVKFALTYFQSICEQILEHPQIQETPKRDAALMRDKLDVFLVQSFLREVGNLEQLPIGNQTLQRREGYRQILETWLLVDAAAQLDWPGREAVYDSNNRNVAVLYEYWLFFSLYRILKSNPNIQQRPDSQDTDSNPFVIPTDSGLRISLKQGQKSRVIFVWQPSVGELLHIHLYYNREFRPKSSPDGIFMSGSYSRTLRPDYSVVIFPERFVQGERYVGAERDAEEAGQIVYLHFDAKYRVETIEGLFGKADENADISSIEGQEELRDEHELGSVTNMYKRADLYKMHAYNDAIRRTSGSYVLYPGRDTGKRAGETRFRKYHEILPGVGAFIMRPGFSEDLQFAVEGEDTLGTFLNDVFVAVHNRFTQQYRLSYWTHHIVKTPPAGRDNVAHWTIPIKSDARPAQDLPVLLGYISPEFEEVVEDKSIFYLAAVDQVTSKFIPASFLSAQFFIGYRNGSTIPKCWEIKESILVSKDDLVSRLMTKPTGLDAAYYVVFELGDCKVLDTLPVRLEGSDAPNKAQLTTWYDLVANC